MRFTTALLFAGVASASFVTRQNVPQCALTCIASANLGGCSSSDNSCLCSNQAFISSTTTCIESTCKGDDLTNAEAFAQATCEAVGVTLTATPSGSASGSGSGSAASGSVSATATTPSGSSTGSSTSAASSTTSSSAAKATGIPVFAAAALGLAAFAL